MQSADTRLRKVYPRECGGTVLYMVDTSTDKGLSPRVRGNRPDLRQERGGIRSIPASAGEPSLTMASALSAAVYPRECGGTLIHLCRYENRAGLSPRVRGNRPGSSTIGEWLRSIPASAGEPAQLIRHMKLYPVYPRECGGTRYVSVAVGEGVGLSPRVRGNPVGAWFGGLLHRSIPASAGEPLRTAYKNCPSTVYPRECGGTRDCRSGCIRKRGLSPRVRGNPLGAVGPLNRHGSIPASAGEPCRLHPVVGISTVYPRECGGTPRKILHQ